MPHAYELFFTFNMPSNFQEWRSDFDRVASSKAFIEKRKTHGAMR